MLWSTWVLCGVSVFVVPLLMLGALRLARPRLRPDLAIRWLARAGDALCLSAIVALGVAAARGLAAVPEVAQWGGWDGPEYGAPSLVFFATLFLVFWFLVVLAVRAGAAAVWQETMEYMRSELTKLPHLDGRLEHLADGSPIEVHVFDEPRHGMLLEALSPPRLLVTSGALARLDESHYRAALAQTHAQLHDHLVYLPRVMAVARSFPLLRPLRDHMLYHCARAADEVGAAVVGDRARYANTLEAATDPDAYVLFFEHEELKLPVDRWRAAALRDAPAAPTGRWPVLVLAALAAVSVAATALAVANTAVFLLS
ncbi:hypothetical protein V5P93_004512 [Actinokineospora auranticolor]|uniref:Zn-dependent protease with chaperone function n=1 Tax=Actinokineospora auranticolor TaxID=155976 RepID=A0A2S6GT07_9PSEU|nr:hypothetical protein [Actinokineospora auranticolor]PPK68382.1 hypothetical protein CLV40_105105 [Actinokineospora auranticolor]